MIERLPHATGLGDVENVWLFARGERAVVWARDGTSRVLEPSTGRIVLAFPAVHGRVIAPEAEGALALVSVPRAAGGFDLALWDLGDDVRRVGQLEALAPRPSFAWIRGARITTFHGGGRRMVFDRGGRQLSDEPVELARPDARTLWAELGPDDHTLLRATPAGEVFVLTGAREVAIAGALAPISMKGDLHVRGSLDATGRRLVLFLRQLARARVVDLVERRVVDGPWTDATARGAFHCGESLVVVEGDVLRSYARAGASSRPLEPGARVVRLDRHRAAIVGRESVEVLDVVRDEVVARAPLPSGVRPSVVVAGDGLLALASPSEGLVVLRVA